MKTKLYTVVLTVMTLAVATTGCSNDFESCNDSGALSGTDTEVPLQVAGGSISADVQTRATTIAGGDIGIFRTTANGYGALYDVQYSYNNDNGGWEVAPSADTVFLGQKPATLCAYYPYGCVSFTANTFDAILSAQEYASDKDMCYAITGGTNVCNKTPGATFAMTHAYSRIQLSITRDAADTNHGTGAVSNINFKSGSTFYSSRTLNITNSDLGGIASNGGWTYGLNTTIGLGGNAEVNLLVPPQTVSGGLTITLYIDGTPRSATVPANMFDTNGLVAGKIYKIGLEIAGAQITIGTVSVNDYGSVENTNGSIAYVPPIVWAPGNLVKTGNTYTFARQTEHGSYFGWNTLDDSAGVYNSGEYSESNDPCTKVSPAGTWVTPTIDQIRELRSYPGSWTGNGRQFGGKYSNVFLPAAGSRYPGGGLTSVGSHGKCMSRTPIGNYAKSLSFFSDGSFNEGDSDRRYGIPVRCVQK